MPSANEANIQSIECDERENTHAESEFIEQESSKMPRTYPNSKNQKAPHPLT